MTSPLQKIFLSWLVIGKNNTGSKPFNEATISRMTTFLAQLQQLSLSNNHSNGIRLSVHSPRAFCNHTAESITGIFYVNWRVNCNPGKNFRTIWRISTAQKLHEVNGYIALYLRIKKVYYSVADFLKNLAYVIVQNFYTPGGVSSNFNDFGNLEFSRSELWVFKIMSFIKSFKKIGIRNTNMGRRSQLGCWSNGTWSLNLEWNIKMDIRYMYPPVCPNHAPSQPSRLYQVPRPFPLYVRIRPIGQADRSLAQRNSLRHLSITVLTRDP
jgi:hypothetical protein